MAGFPANLNLNFLAVCSLLYVIFLEVSIIHCSENNKYPCDKCSTCLLNFRH